MKYFTVLLIYISILCLTSCGAEREQKAKPHALAGMWRGTLQLQGQELPFHFRISGKSPDSLLLTLINGKEELEAGLIQLQGDSLIMPMHVFDTEIRAVVVANSSLQGNWIKNYADDYVVPFQAKKGESFRFETSKEAPAIDLSGRWSVSFTAEDSSGAPNAVGIFEQKVNSLTGTFLTPTGDYRYLEGSIAGTNFYLSAFDGEHAFLFKGIALDSNRIEGTYWSGKSWEEKWIGVRNSSASLPSADSLTYLRQGYDSLSFTFPNLQGEMVSLSDPKYRNKVVVVQLFGSWCPNCMDETKFLADWHERNKGKDVAIIGLAYEKKDNFEYARQRVQNMVDKLDVGYDFLIAGSSDNKKAAESLPMLNHVMAFPTTIFLDKTGTIRRIHTGFSGPGTGEAYEQFIQDFNLYMNKLLAEPATTNKK